MKKTERFDYIGDHIRHLRETKGWTQQALGKRLGKRPQPLVPMRPMPSCRPLTV